MELEIEKILSQMTLEEKASLCSGADFWHTKAIERLGLPAVMVTDGPHGLRKQEGESDHLGLNESVRAVCYPSGAGLASSFDTNLIRQLGEVLGETAAGEGVHTLLGPAVNIKRSPLCGRNFEYLSEDPWLAGEMAAAYVQGVQSRGVGTSVKHFAANNQESSRMSVSAEVSERALREIYLVPFEKTVRQAQPWTVMCAYNRINGTYCCENEWLLDQVLREEWGFDGIVMTDWGAMNDRCRALKAGLELEMPDSGGENDKRIVERVKSDLLDEAVLDEAVRRLLRWIARGNDPKAPAPTYDRQAQHEFARQAAGQTAVLLKNEGVLPLKQGASLAFIGGFAKRPRYQGGGSSHINSVKVTNALESCASLARIRYAEGFSVDSDQADGEKLQEAVAAAREAECAVIFAGLPDAYESEGYDRTHLDLPACQNELIEAVAAVQPNTVVVLHNGSPITMPWLDKVAAVLEMYLGGEAVGEAEADLLFGAVNPSGRLAETFPLRLEDTPSFLNFPGNGKRIFYGEDVYVGYRWYDARKMEVLFPFGYGLSYTSFVYTDIALDCDRLDAQKKEITVKVKVKNTGARSGREVVQLYVRPQDHTDRPVQELKGFAKVELAPGEEREVLFHLDCRSFELYDERLHKWILPAGKYEIGVGPHSRSLPLRAVIEAEWRGSRLIDDTTTLGEVLDSGRHVAAIDAVAKALGVSDDAGTGEGLGAGTDQMMRELMRGLPLRRLVTFGGMTHEQIQDMIVDLVFG